LGLGTPPPLGSPRRCLFDRFLFLSPRPLSPSVSRVCRRLLLHESGVITVAIPFSSDLLFNVELEAESPFFFFRSRDPNWSRRLDFTVRLAVSFPRVLFFCVASRFAYELQWSSGFFFADCFDPLADVFDWLRRNAALGLPGFFFLFFRSTPAKFPFVSHFVCFDRGLVVVPPRGARLCFGCAGCDGALTFFFFLPSPNRFASCPIWFGVRLGSVFIC